MVAKVRVAHKSKLTQITDDIISLKFLKEKYTLNFLQFL